MLRPNALRTTISHSGRRTITSSANDAMRSSIALAARRAGKKFTVDSRQSTQSTVCQLLTVDCRRVVSLGRGRFLVLAVFVARLRRHVEDVGRDLVAAH